MRDASRAGSRLHGRSLAHREGRSTIALTVGAAASAGLGLLAVEWMTRRTRLTEDAAIGAVLSVFFGFGIVLMTVVQTLETEDRRASRAISWARRLACCGPKPR